jgi:predicted tellurium resistance membrane protein TerC
MEEYLTMSALASLLTLTGLEIVLGIDNVIFIAILVGKLPEHERTKVRNLGLFLAMFMRIGLLLGITWIMGLKKDLFTLFGHGFTGKDLILLAGGLFLLAKSTHEIHEKVEDSGHEHGPRKASASRTGIIGQIIAIDLVFSLDSIITAVGMAQQVGIMIAAVVIAVGAMMIFSGKVSAFIERHPTIKMLALSFLLMIGIMLVADGLGHHIEKGYIYFAMAFSLGVEALNIRIRSKQMKREATPNAGP